MLRRTVLVSSFLAAGAVACGNVIVDPNAGSGTGGSTSSTTTTAVSTGTGTGTVTTATSTTGAGGAPTCGETHDSLSFSLSTYDGHVYSCGGENGIHAIKASVVDVGAGVVTLDSCPPNADCTPFLSKLVIDAPGLALDLPKGTYVQVKVSAMLYQGGCANRVMITNLPSWGGEPNPVVSGEVLWLLAADGDQGTFEDSPLVVETVPLGCFPGEPMGCGAHEDYLWRFRPAKDPYDAGMTVAMGQTLGWFFMSGGFSQQVLGRNLRSYSLGICDGPSDFGYWIVHQYGLD